MPASTRYTTNRHRAVLPRAAWMRGLHDYSYIGAADVPSLFLFHPANNLLEMLRKGRVMETVS